MHGARSFGDFKTIAHIAHIAYIMVLISIHVMPAWLRATMFCKGFSYQSLTHCPHCPQ